MPTTIESTVPLTRNWLGNNPAILSYAGAVDLVFSVKYCWLLASDISGSGAS